MPLFDSSPACMPGLRFWLPGPVRQPGRPRMPARSLGSRACSFSTCVRLLDYAGPVGNSRFRSRQCGLPVASTRSAPGIRFSKLDSSPVDASVYASPGTSRHPAQDSRSRWFATPFLWGSFIPDCTPVYPDAFERLRSHLGFRVLHGFTLMCSVCRFVLFGGAGSGARASQIRAPGLPSDSYADGSRHE